MNMKYLINILNTKLLLAAAVVLLLVGANTAFAAGAREYENPPCYDVTGTTQEVLVNPGGVNNGGIMNFDDPGVDVQYQACVRMSSFAANAVPVRLEGWVWNDNLGWVSLYCPGGAGAMNLDIACGTQPYSVTFSTIGTGPDFTSVAMSGYAWGDNIGWISFSEAVFQMKPLPSGANRGLVSAGSPAADKHAWADSVGWFDFSGVRFWWEDSDPFVVDTSILQYVSVCSDDDRFAGPPAVGSPQCSCDLDGTCTGLSDEFKIPNANGSTAYNVEVGFVDGAVPPVINLALAQCPGDSINMYATGLPGKSYCYRVAFEWEDDVDKDQTTSASQSQSAPKYNAVNTGAVTGKPFAHTDLAYNALRRSYEKDVVSVAPTSDRNTYDGMQNEKFFNYPGIGLGGYDPALISQNLLKLTGIKLLFFKYSVTPGVPGECIYGEIIEDKCVMYDYMVPGGTNLSFDPLIGIAQLFNQVGGKNLAFISIASIDAAQKFFMERAVDKAGATSPVVNMIIGLADEANYALRFVTAFPETDYFAAFANQDLPGTPQNWDAQVFNIGDPAAVVSDVGPYLYSKITYSVLGQSVAYWGAKLPRIAGGVLINPVAKVQGNVYVTDFAKKAADVSLKSLGNISSNLRRETVTRNVAKYLTGYGSVTTGDGTVSGATTPPTINVPNTLVAGKVYYVKDGNLTFNCVPTCTFNSSVTFIVENGNIFLNSNITTTGDAQVGLIALRNLEGNVQNQGFLYLDKDVTWLNDVHIYLDRVMQSYDKTSLSFDANGFAKVATDDYDRQTKFINQLVYEGTMSSMNGIGNASQAVPTDENGTPVGGSTYCSNYAADPVSGICRARVVDLNYLRYYGPGLEICTGTEGTGGAVSGVPRDQALKAAGLGVDTALGCNPSDPSYNIVGTDLYANDVNADLIPGASGGVKSAYFGGSNTLDTEFPVNFFYTPIANDLAGFEVDQAFNPVLQQ